MALSEGVHLKTMELLEKEVQRIVEEVAASAGFALNKEQKQELADRILSSQVLDKLVVLIGEQAKEAARLKGILEQCEHCSGVMDGAAAGSEVQDSNVVAESAVEPDPVGVQAQVTEGAGAGTGTSSMQPFDFEEDRFSRFRLMNLFRRFLENIWEKKVMKAESEELPARFGFGWLRRFRPNRWKNAVQMESEEKVPDEYSFDFSATERADDVVKVALDSFGLGKQK